MPRRLRMRHQRDLHLAQFEERPVPGKFFDHLARQIRTIEERESQISGKRRIGRGAQQFLADGTVDSSFQRLAAEAPAET